MNISKITQILDERKKAADEAAKIQAVFDALDKICSEHGFESYAGFLKKVSALEAADAAVEEEVEHDTGKSERKPKTSRKGRTNVTEALVAQMKEAMMNRGKESRASIAKRLSISPVTLKNYEKCGFVYAPKPKGRKKAKI
jgi:hypothetical protein